MKLNPTYLAPRDCSQGMVFTENELGTIASSQLVMFHDTSRSGLKFQVSAIMELLGSSFPWLSTATKSEAFNALVEAMTFLLKAAAVIVVMKLKVRKIQLYLKWKSP